MARNCDFVPLRVEFPKQETAGTAFEGQTALKLGTHCRGDKVYENYTIREYLTYRLFNLITPLSFRARLGRATYVDATIKKTGRDALLDLHRARERGRPPLRRPHRRAAAHRVQRPRRADADADDDVRVHDRQHRLFDLGAAQRPHRAGSRAHALSGPVRLRSLRIRPRAVRVARPAHRHPQRARSPVPRPVPHRPTSSRPWRRRSAPSAPTC